MKKGVFVIISILVIGLITYKYIYKEHRDIQIEAPFFRVEANEIMDEFSVGFKLTFEKYFDKTIQITGKLTAVNKTNLELNSNIVCYLNSPINLENSIGDIVTIKGRCIGFDDLLEELKLDQCSIVSE